MHRWKRSFFVEVLMSFLFLLCIPLITISMILLQANMTVKKQTVNLESQNMQLYVELMDEVTKDLQDTCINIFSIAECRLYSYKGAGNIAWESSLQERIVKALENQTKLKYYDVFVYYYRDERIFSGKYASLMLDDYYKAYYSDFWKIDYKEAFENMLRSDNKKPTCHVINSGSEEQYLCMTMGTRNYTDPQANYTICVVLDPEYINGLQIMDNVDQDRAFLMYNKNRELLLSNNKNKEVMYWSEEVLDENTEWNEWLEKEDYVIKIAESKNADNIYVYAISSAMFWDTLKQLRMYCYGGVVLCILISGIFSYWSAVRVYRPVSKIMNFLNRKSTDISAQRTKEEFSHIMSFLEKQEERLRKNRKNSQEWFVYGLLEGKYKNVDMAMCKEHDIFFEASRFMVCIIHAEILNAEIEELCSFIIQNIFKELCDTMGGAYFISLSENKYAILINTNEDCNELCEVLQGGQSFCREKFQLVLTLGCSAGHEGAGEIAEAYKEAQEAIRYRFLLGREKLIRYTDIQDRSNSYRSDEKSKVFMLLMEYVENRKKNNNVNDFAERLMSIYQMNEEVSVDVALTLKNEIVGALGRIMTLYGYEKNIVLHITEKLRETVTLSEFKQLLSEQIAELCSMKIKRKDNEDVLTDVKDYIEKNYNNNKLSVAMLGKEMGLQAAYLSKMFKERYGITILDYIAAVRINEAKRNICEKGGTIQEIAENTGFLSSHVFIKTFKKIEGVTPGRYKEMLEKGQL